MPVRVPARVLGFALLLAGFGRPALAAELREVRLDWATYNPVSIVLKDQGLLEKAFGNDVTVRWVQSRGSNKCRS